MEQIFIASTFKSKYNIEINVAQNITKLAV